MRTDGNSDARHSCLDTLRELTKNDTYCRYRHAGITEVKKFPLFAPYDETGPMSPPVGVLLSSIVIPPRANYETQNYDRKVVGSDGRSLI